MKVTIKYFGMIAEATGKSDEILDLESGVSVQDLKDQQINKYKIAQQRIIYLRLDGRADLPLPVTRPPYE